MTTIEFAVSLGEKAFNALTRVNQKRKGPEILLFDMFYKPKVLRPELWEFDEEKFHDGLPVKIVNNSDDKHFTISFFRFRTEYSVENQRRKRDYERIPIREGDPHDLAPRHTLEFSLPWRAVMQSAHESRILETKKDVKNLKFTLHFHDDFRNSDYSSKPLYPFRVRSEASRALGMFEPRMPVADILLKSKEGKTLAFIEVKNIENLSKRDATEIRSRIQEFFPSLANYFFMILTQDKTFVWSPISKGSSSAPHEFETKNIVQFYRHQKAGVRLREIELQLLLFQWLSDLASGLPVPSLEPERSFLDLGLMEQIRGSRVFMDDKP